LDSEIAKLARRSPHHCAEEIKYKHKIDLGGGKNLSLESAFL
jgi:hypothetical protein